jgi:GcrA cell cycle regulator
VSTLHERIRVVAGTRNEGPWAVEGRVELLTQLWGDGFSASQIAGRLGGGLTRNAVIAKVHRLGLAGRAHAIARTYIRGRARTKPKAKSANKRFNIGNSPLRRLYLVQPTPLPSPTEQDIPRKRLDDLQDGDCRWPVTVADGNHHFCADPKVPGLPYCDPHSRRAFQPPTALYRPPPAERIPTFSDAEREDA